MILPIEASMKHKEKFPLVMFGVMGLITVIYITFGAVSHSLPRFMHAAFWFIAVIVSAFNVKVALFCTMLADDPTQPCHRPLGFACMRWLACNHGHRMGHVLHLSMLQHPCISD